VAAETITLASSITTPQQSGSPSAWARASALATPMPPRHAWSGSLSEANSLRIDHIKSPSKYALERDGTTA
jgi:hypothetical protein